MELLIYREFEFPIVLIIPDSLIAIELPLNFLDGCNDVL